MEAESSSSAGLDRTNSQLARRDQPHSLFTIPELLGNIFEYADSSTRALGASVNKTFSEAALDLLWKELPSLFPLLLVMGRLVYVRSSRAWHFQDPPTYRDWKRYVFYARRVRTLTHRDHGGNAHDAPKVLSPYIISQLKQFAQIDSILLLPNLKSIHWGAGERARANALGDVTPFLSPSVKEIHIESTIDMTEHEAMRIVQNLSMVPDLQLSKFSLTTVSPTEPNTQLIQPFSNFLAQQRRIAHLAFPSIYPMERRLFTETVGHLEYLTALHITLPVRYFSECAGILAALLDVRPALTVLNITMVRFGIVDGSDEDWEDVFTFDSIRTLLGFQRLTALDIDYWSGLLLTDEDIVSMGEAWPFMTELYLCHQGHHEEKRGAPVSSLSVFAESFPNLVKLGLFIQPGRGPLPQPYSAPCSSSPKRAFPSQFEVLDVGGSWIPVEHVPAMAEFLVALSLPNPFVVAFNPKMQHNEPSFTDWRGVRDAYITGIRIRNAINQRYSAENEELKAKIALLEQYVPLELASQETFRRRYQPIISAIVRHAANADQGTAAESAAGPPDQSSV